MRKVGDFLARIPTSPELAKVEAIVIFGGLAQAGEMIFTPTQKYMESNLLDIHKGKIKLLQSGLAEGDAAVLGASALIWQELKI